MKRANQSREPRSAVVLRHTRDAMRTDTRMCIRKFASRVAENYMAAVDEHDREISFHVGTTIDTACDAEKANAQLIGRILNGTVRLPDDLEEAWVQALPDPHRLDCARELARRYGFLGAMMPTESDTPVNTAGDLALRFGAALQALGPILADGRIDQNDCPQQVLDCLRLGTDMAAAWMTLSKQLLDALPPQMQAQQLRAVKSGRG